MPPNKYAPLLRAEIAVQFLVDNSLVKYPMLGENPLFLKEANDIGTCPDKYPHLYSHGRNFKWGVCTASRTMRKLSQYCIGNERMFNIQKLFRPTLMIHFKSQLSLFCICSNIVQMIHQLEIYSHCEMCTLNMIGISFISKVNFYNQSIIKKERSEVFMRGNWFLLSSFNIPYPPLIFWLLTKGYLQRLKNRDIHCRKLVPNQRRYLERTPRYWERKQKHRDENEVKEFDKASEKCK